MVPNGGISMPMTKKF